MSRTIAFLVASSGCALLAATAWGQRAAEGLVSESEARRFGLERVWVTQVEVDPARGRVVNLASYVSVADITTVFDVQYDGRRRTFSEHDLDRFGKVLGKAGAKREAEEFVAELKERKLEGKVEKILIPETSLYATSDRAIVHAIDAESGATRWAELIGDRNHPTECPAASEPYLAILNGSDLYLLKRKTGEIIWKRRVQGVPGAGAAVTDDYVVVPTISGNVELYQIKETRVTLPEIYKSNGRVLVQPIATAQVVAWPTDRGFLYVARSNKKGLRYRLEAKDAIVSQASYFAPNYFFAASIDGYVYCLHEMNGTELWLFSTGEAISTTPVPVGENLYVITDKGNLFCIEISTGQSKWISSGLKSFVSASQDRVYCLGDTGRLVILDTKTGGRIGSLGTQLLDLFYPNLRTDRIYLGTRTGLLVCLRETNRVWPLIHAGVIDPDEVKKEEGAAEEAGEGEQAGEGKPPKGKPAEAKPKKKPAADGGAKPPAGKADDPFGAGGGAADPFGGGKDEKPAAGAQDDPFGGGAAPAKPAAKKGQGAAPDPFGGGAAPGAGGAADDPFK